MALNLSCSACSRSRYWLSYSISFGSGSRIATLTMVFKPGMEAQKHWRRLNGPELVAKVVIGVKFVDGEEQIEQAA